MDRDDILRNLLRVTDKEADFYSGLLFMSLALVEEQRQAGNEITAEVIADAVLEAYKVCGNF